MGGFVGLVGCLHHGLLDKMISLTNTGYSAIGILVVLIGIIILLSICLLIKKYLKNKKGYK